MAAKKRIVIIAGPNGAGKTTFARDFLPNEAHCPDFINADLIAAGLHNFHKRYKSLADAWILYDNGGDEPVIIDAGAKP